jgi:hypothetical protein
VAVRGLAGVPVVLFHRYVSGEAIIGFPALAAVCEAFGLSAPTSLLVRRLASTGDLGTTTRIPGCAYAEEYYVFCLSERQYLPRGQGRSPEPRRRPLPGPTGLLSWTNSAPARGKKRGR